MLSLKRPGAWFGLSALAAFSFLSAGCNDTVTVTFSAGCTDCESSPIEFEVSSSELDLPQEFRDDSGSEPRVREVSCGPGGTCPSPSDSRVSIQCEQGLCDPERTTIEVPVGDVLDFEQVNRELRELFTRVEEFEILEVRYRVAVNTLTVDLGETELFWGPPGATAIDPSMGVQRLGTVDPLQASEKRMGQVAIDADGEQALSDHLVNVESRVRFFARTSADIDPGDLWPEGSLRVRVAIRVRAKGSML
jgi:hypothetical protein